MPYLDLEYKTRTNSAFSAVIDKYCADIASLYEKRRHNSSHEDALNSKLTEFVKFCSMNPVFLMPFYFPKYPKDQPLSFHNYPFSFQLLNVIIGTGSMVIRGSRQISKSTTFAARQLMLTKLMPKFASLYICPRSDQRDTYAGRLLEMQRAMLGYEPDYRLRNNLNLKEFANGSKIELVYVNTSATNIRGKSVDEILFDEAQDFDPELEIETQMVQSASETPITTYAGTSLTTDTFLEKKYSESSQGVWVMRCPRCNTENIPLPEYGVFEMILPQGPSCIKCRKLLNVRNGIFMHANLEAYNNERIGLHIPQLIVPAVVRNPSRWAKIHELMLKGDKRKFLQEILGMPTEEGEREITRKNLEEICILGKDLEALKRKAVSRKYQYVVSGCDWGGSDYNPMTKTKISTTVHVIMGVAPTGDCDIIHISRYTGMNYDDIVRSILRNHDNYGGQVLAADFGVGAAYNSRIREHMPPEKHVVFGYVGPASELISEPTEFHMFNQWSLNKTESLTMVFDAIRRRRIRCFHWDYSSEYLLDCLNMYRAPGEKAGAAGTNTFIYRSSASRPNDTLQAMNYAFMLAKIMLGEPMFADLSVKLRMDQTLTGSYGMNYVAQGYSG